MMRLTTLAARPFDRDSRFVVEACDNGDLARTSRAASHPPSAAPAITRRSRQRTSDSGALFRKQLLVSTLHVSFHHYV